MNFYDPKDGANGADGAATTEENTGNDAGAATEQAAEGEGELVD